MKIRINCKHWNTRLQSCVNPERRFFFGFIQNNNCPILDKDDSECEYRVKTPKPSFKPPPQTPRI